MNKHHFVNDYLLTHYFFLFKFQWSCICGITTMPLQVQDASKVVPSGLRIKNSY